LRNWGDAERSAQALHSDDSGPVIRSGHWASVHTEQALKTKRGAEPIVKEILEAVRFGFFAA